MYECCERSLSSIESKDLARFHDAELGRLHYPDELAFQLGFC